MKLKEINLLDIKAKENEYEYTYGVYASSFFRKIYFKFIFTSKFPHFWWTEIQKMMINKDIYFEDLRKNLPVDIKIGKLTYADFTKEEINRFGENIHEWKNNYLDRAIEKSMGYQKEYNKINGNPDLTGTGLLSDYEENKKW